MPHRIIRTSLSYLALGVLFILFGVWVRLQMPASIYCGQDTEIYSFDFLGYAFTMADYRYMGYGRFRHPLWGWLTSPVPLLGERFMQFGEWYFWIYLLCFFATVGVGCVILLRRILQKFTHLSSLETCAITCLYLSFAHVWLLAGMPETFGVSMLLALATLNWALGSAARRELSTIVILGETQTAPGLGAKVDLGGWILLAVLTGGITISQVAKTAIAYSLTHRRWLLRLILTGLICTAAASIVILIFYIRVQLRLKANPNAPGMGAAWETLFGCLAPLGMSLAERLRLIWIFFSEPIILRGEPFEQRVIVGGYGSFVQPLLLVVLYASVVASAWINRHQLLTRIIVGMFLVDVCIHFIAGWGLAESQLYGGHWMYALPILVGMLFPKLGPIRRTWATVAVFALAAALFACNLHGYFCHPVGVAS